MVTSVRPDPDRSLERFIGKPRMERRAVGVRKRWRRSGRRVRGEARMMRTAISPRLGNEDFLEHQGRSVPLAFDGERAVDHIRRAGRPVTSTADHTGRRRAEAPGCECPGPRRTQVHGRPQRCSPSLTCGREKRHVLRRSPLATMSGFFAHLPLRRSPGISAAGGARQGLGHVGQRSAQLQLPKPVSPGE